MKRSSARPATSSRLVEPTSVTAQSLFAAASTASIASGRALTGAATNTISAPSAAAAALVAASPIAPRRSASSHTLASGSKPITCAPRRSPTARPIDPPISPTPTMPTFTRC